MPSSYENIYSPYHLKMRKFIASIISWIPFNFEWLLNPNANELLKHIISEASFARHDSESRYLLRFDDPFQISDDLNRALALACANQQENAFLSQIERLNYELASKTKQKKSFFKPAPSDPRFLSNPSFFALPKKNQVKFNAPDTKLPHNAPLSQQFYLSLVTTHTEAIDFLEALRAFLILHNLNDVQLLFNQCLITAGKSFHLTLHESLLWQVTDPSNLKFSDFKLHKEVLTSHELMAKVGSLPFVMALRPDQKFWELEALGNLNAAQKQCLQDFVLERVKASWLSKSLYAASEPRALPLHKISAGAHDAHWFARLLQKSGLSKEAIEAHSSLLLYATSAHNSKIIQLLLRHYHFNPQSNEYYNVPLAAWVVLFDDVETFDAFVKPTLKGPILIEGIPLLNCIIENHFKLSEQMLDRVLSLHFPIVDALPEDLNGHSSPGRLRATRHSQYPILKTNHERFMSALQSLKKEIILTGYNPLDGESIGNRGSIRIPTTLTSKANRLLNDLEKKVNEQPHPIIELNETAQNKSNTKNLRVGSKQEALDPLEDQKHGLVPLEPTLYLENSSGSQNHSSFFCQKLPEPGYLFPSQLRGESSRLSPPNSMAGFTGFVLFNLFLGWFIHKLILSSAHYYTEPRPIKKTPTLTI